MKAIKTTKIEALRKKFESEQISLPDLVKYFDPTKNRQLTKLLTEDLIEKLKQPRECCLDSEVYNHIHTFENRGAEIINITHNRILSSVLEQVYYLIGRETLYFAERFKKYLDENKVAHNMDEYKSFEDIKSVVSALDIAEFTKSNLLSTHKVYEDGTWLIILPLTSKASQIYGSGTKWCTTMRDNEHQYFQATTVGILMYIINKTDNRKYAYQRAIKSRNAMGERLSQFYTAEDAMIDSVDLDIPYQILNKIKEFIADTPYSSNSEYPNYNLAELEEYEKMRGCKNEVVMSEPAIQEITMQITIPVDTPVQNHIAHLLEVPMDSPQIQ